MSLTLGIRLLGGFSIIYGDRLVVEITSERAQTLLAYLVLHRQAAQPRQRIALKNGSSYRAEGNLHQAASREIFRRLTNSHRFVFPVLKGSWGRLHSRCFYKA
ncbi:MULTISPECIES: hypothetical protein [Trichocoleus]|uniref:Uncharacterized protein n=1 Tax=Trichocoleus desertorum GB2-A4 TaxID=2933944 RepID=A0ABV0JG17_9CYAN|nr:hypothetical protein [Trichocoleus sp. FACHB-46]MBD1864811.1 hypothetical protein [Trichocoleus sp. FACHB-46]